MFLKNTRVHIADGTNIRWVKTFHLYKGFFRKITKIGFFIKGSAQVVEPPRIEYKGFKYKFNIKGDINRILLVRSFKFNNVKDSSNNLIRVNSGIILKKKSNPRSKFLYGIISSNIFRRKIITLYSYVI